MSSSSSACGKITDLSIQCRRKIGNKYCCNNVDSLTRYGLTRCSSCENLCTFINACGQTCCQPSSPFAPNEYCESHLIYIKDLEDYNNFKEAQEYHKDYVFCGSHIEDGDEVYHYISREKLGIRNIDELNKDEYDDIIYFSDNIHLYCGPSLKTKYRGITIPALPVSPHILDN